MYMYMIGGRKICIRKRERERKERRQHQQTTYTHEDNVYFDYSKSYSTIHLVTKP